MVKMMQNDAHNTHSLSFFENYHRTKYTETLKNADGRRDILFFSLPPYTFLKEHWRQLNVSAIGNN